MDLETFVAGSLRAIVAGLRRAQAEGDGSEAREDHRRLGALNPTLTRTPPDAVRLLSANGEPVYEVAFDIAVTVAEKAGANTSIKVFGLGIDGSTESSGNTVSRLQFKLPIEWPR